MMSRRCGTRLSRYHRAPEAEAERTQQEAAQRFLAEASTLLSSLEATTQLAHLAQLLVPTLVDWCSIDLLQAVESWSTEYQTLAAA
jgi:hypothetical protein